MGASRKEQNVIKICSFKRTTLFVLGGKLYETRDNYGYGNWKAMNV